MDTTYIGDSRVIINANSYRALILMSTQPILALSYLAINLPKKNKKGQLKNGYIIYIILN